MADHLITDRDGGLFGEESTATFSPCRTYRYALTRRWEEDDSDGVAFLMLNPSTADAMADDPTIRRCVGFAKTWGFGGLLVLNLFALRATDPKQLYGHDDPVGPDNDAVIGGWLDRLSGPVVAAWGVHGAYRQRHAEVTDLVRAHGKQLMCLGATKDGHPKHPLYVAASTPLVRHAEVAR